MAEVGKTLHLNIDTITDTVKRYNTKGIDGLLVSKGGRPEGNPKWNKKIFDDLVKEIDKQDKYWSVPIMMSWIKKKKGKDIPYNTVWYHMKDLNYSNKSARPHPYLGNQKEQDSFKKRALLTW
jgi:transposase